MQTFVPYDDFAMSARALDYRRLGKQRVEALQILQSLTPVEGRKHHGWRNHPATRMWENNIDGLAAYGIAICDEWIGRGYKDTVRGKILSAFTPDPLDLPFWWGDDVIHSSHRANLLRKDFDFYSRHGWTEDPEMPYIWPQPVG